MTGESWTVSSTGATLRVLPDVCHKMNRSCSSHMIRSTRTRVRIRTMRSSWGHTCGIRARLTYDQLLLPAPRGNLIQGRCRIQPVTKLWLLMTARVLCYKHDVTFGTRGSAPAMWPLSMHPAFLAM